MIITGHLRKRKDALIVTVRVVKLNAKDASVKVMARSSTMLAPIARVDSRMYRPELQAVMQIVFANLHVLK